MDGVLKKPVTFIFLVLLTLLMLIPLLWVLLLSFKTSSEIFTEPLRLPKTWHFENYKTAFVSMHFFRLFKNTMVIATISILGGFIINIMSSFAIARFKFGSGKIQHLFYLYYVSGVIVPVFVLLFPIYVMNAKMHLINTPWSMILPYLGWSVPLDTLLLVGALKSFPASVEDAAVIDGCGIFQLIIKIALPIIKPTLITVLIFSFLGMWNEFPLAVVMINSPENYTIALAVSYFKGMFSVNYSLMTAGIVIITIPQLIFYTIFQRYIIEGVTSGAVKG
jgi:raffinose/stachyose/melibiose transport system permease protein